MRDFSKEGGIPLEDRVQNGMTQRRMDSRADYAQLLENSLDHFVEKMTLIAPW